MEGQQRGMQIYGSQTGAFPQWLAQQGSIGGGDEQVSLQGADAPHGVGRVHILRLGQGQALTLGKLRQGTETGLQIAPRGAFRAAEHQHGRRDFQQPAQGWHSKLGTAGKDQAHAYLGLELAPTRMFSPSTVVAASSLSLRLSLSLARAPTRSVNRIPSRWSISCCTITAG